MLKHTIAILLLLLAAGSAANAAGCGPCGTNGNGAPREHAFDQHATRQGDRPN